MAKNRTNRKSRRNLMKTFRNTANTALPVVNKGLKSVGNTAKKVVTTSVPIVQKGVSAVYGTMATGFDLGVKGVRNVEKKVRRVRSTGPNRKTKRKSMKQ